MSYRDNFHPSWSLLLDPRYFLALGLGSGLSRWAPGTCGTIAAVPFFLLFLSSRAPIEYFLIVMAAFLLGIYICREVSKKMKIADHPSIVWDEFVGLWITLFGLPNEIDWLIAGIVIFRLLDIAKPWPVSLIDSRIKGGTGIMLDDAVAGLIGCCLLNLVNHLFF
ncbi:MAG: phosphatidylglycerophosphatase A [Halieaceae bacterium]|nr:phosphatidylglycerophosphatase A [Halieaceae bacterium]